MAKHRIGTEWKQPPKISYLPRSPGDVPEMMILDESETLLGNQYAGVIMNNTEKFLSPTATIVEMSGVAAMPASLAAPIRKQLNASPLAARRLKGTDNHPPDGAISSNPALILPPSGPNHFSEATRSFVKAQRRYHTGRATFQGQVYNFLERPTGWKCFIYHMTVSTASQSVQRAVTVSNIPNCKEERDKNYSDAGEQQTQI